MWIVQVCSDNELRAVFHHMDHQAFCTPAWTNVGGWWGAETDVAQMRVHAKSKTVSETVSDRLFSPSDSFYRASLGIYQSNLTYVYIIMVLDAAGESLRNREWLYPTQSSFDLGHKFNHDCSWSYISFSRDIYLCTFLRMFGTIQNDPCSTGKFCHSCESCGLRWD